MKRGISPNQQEESTTKRNIKSKRKKPYRNPRLVVYGALSHLTAGKGGHGTDGGGIGHSRA